MHIQSIEKMYPPIVLSNTDKEICYKILGYFKEEIRQYYSSKNYFNSSLISGGAGYSLYLYYLALVDEQFKDAKDLAYKNLRKSLHQIQNSQMTSLFFYGFPGIIWTYRHLIENCFIDDEYDFGPIDKYITDSIEILNNEKSIDLLEGFVGLAMYYFDSLQNDKSEMALKKILINLELLSEVNSNGRFWMLHEKKDGKKLFSKRYQFGLAHGAAGIITLLTEYCAHDINFNKAKQLLRESVDFVLAYFTINPGDFSFFPQSIRDDGSEAKMVKQRLGWCNGDLSVVFALLRAATILNDDSLYMKSIEIATYTTKYKDKLKYVNDACFCHGTSGIAHMYNRLYQYTGFEIFRDCSGFWIKKTIDLFKMGDKKINGYTYYEVDRDGQMTKNKNLGLLPGDIGVGMTLISALEIRRTKWDRVFLTDL